jgi:hypothetical protein
MDKLEQYLDQVCRSIGGPKSLRQHVRQELREHLLDAVAEHKAAGMTLEQALERALADFGGPEQVRSELEATHGHRLMPVVIDKAMQWKEKTMKAKWLWASWAYLALGAVIMLEVLFITFANVFIVPKFERLMLDGIIDRRILDEQGTTWMRTFLRDVHVVGGQYTLWLIVIPAVAWILFEWRVRSENKAFMRLSALGTAAVGLTIVVVLMAGSLVISFCLGAPAAGRLVQPFVLDQVAKIDTSVATLEQAVSKKDWEAMQEPADRASAGVENLLRAAPAAPALASGNQPMAFSELQATVDDLRGHVKAASECLREVRQAIHDKDANRLDTALKTFHEEYAPVQAAAKKLVR